MQMLRRRPLLPMRSFHRAYQIQINSLKRGEVISHKGKLWVITSFSHHAQGRGGSHYKVDLRDMKTGAKGHERFNTGSILEGVELQEKKLDFLYISENVVHAIDPDTFEEFNFPIEILEGGSKTLPFLHDSMQLRVKFQGQNPLFAKTPERAIYRVADTPPAPSSTTNESKNMAFKRATLDNGGEIQVPEFVKVGDEIIVNLADQKYVSRAPKN